MKKHKAGLLAAALALGLSASPAMADIVLFDWAFYVDGVATAPTGGSLVDGLGTLSWSTSSDGVHSFTAFFDYEIDEGVNTFFNEYGTASGGVANGQSWEIDEPGYIFGDIYDNVMAGTLDKSNAVEVGSEDDVSFAMGWDFTLLADETATITLNLFELLRDDTGAPANTPTGFFLSQTDPDSDRTIYFTSALDIRGGNPVPEPATMLLMGTGLAGLYGARRKKMKKA